MKSSEEDQKNAELLQSSEQEKDKITQEDIEAVTEAQEKESRRAFADKIGVSFSKGEMFNATPREQVDFILESGSKTAQFWIGEGRGMDEYLPLIAELKEKNPEMIISIHTEAPNIGSNLEIKNVDGLSRDIQMAAKIDCSLVTIHPGSIPMELWKNAPEATREKALDSLTDFYAKNIAATKDSGKILELAIENLPAKGESGNWGQNSDDLAKIIEMTRESLIVNFDFKAEEATAAVGLTLDVNHALTGVPEEQKAEKLAEWFKALSQDIKCVHVYTPSAGKDGIGSVNNQLELLRRLCDRYHIRPEIFLESKKDMETTKQIFEAGREAIMYG